MAPLKPFLQVFPGQNDPNLQPKKGKQIDPKEWERKQKLKEYRIAARREKRNRKSDEKKQRKLNAVILRRMTRNPEKYNKNAGRNRLRAIEQERRRIQGNAIHMVQRIAALYDPSGELFNVKPVTTLEDGRVVTLESLERKKERDAEKELQRQEMEQQEQMTTQDPATLAGASAADRLNPDRMKLLIESKMEQKRPQGLSKTQQKKQAAFQPRDAPPKPVIPAGIDPPSDEENWLDLWSLPDEDLERRVLREKKRKARDRRELRIRQKSGKAERRAARDEKRRVYREIKQSWKILREEERRRRKFLTAMEDEEGRKLADDVTTFHRKVAMDVCAELGFTLDNVEGVGEIQPKVLRMNGVVIDFDKLEYTGEGRAEIKVKEDEKPQHKMRGNRVNLGAIADEKYTEEIYAGFKPRGGDGGMNANFVELGSGLQGQDHEPIQYNHKTRRKLRRAMEGAQVRKELLVREAAIKHCEENNMPVPTVLRTSGRPINVRGARCMEDGTLESAKQERVRSRVELAEFNRNAKILRRQAKEIAVESGIRIYSELMGLIPKREGLDELMEEREREKARQSGHGEAIGGIWPAQSTAAMTGDQSMAELLESWPMPEDPMERYEGTRKWKETNYNDDSTGEDESEDSASKQLKGEIQDSVAIAVADNMDVDAVRSGSTSSASDSDNSEVDSDTDMSDA